MNRIVALTALFTLALVGTAFGNTEGVPSPDPNLLLPGVQFWALLIGAIVPLATYALNHAAPWANEKIKALVLVAASALAGALFQLLYAGNLELDLETLQVVLSSVVGALAAHVGLYRPANINAVFGGGTNKDGKPSV